MKANVKARTQCVCPRQASLLQLTGETVHKKKRENKSGIGGEHQSAETPGAPTAAETAATPVRIVVLVDC